jgi:hypothetical protein
VRGYRFDRSRIGPVRDGSPIEVSRGQLEFELSHLRGKILARAPAALERLPTTADIKPHPLFITRNGPMELWERGAP